MSKLRLSEIKCIIHIFIARKNKLHLSDEANGHNPPYRLTSVFLLLVEQHLTPVSFSSELLTQGQLY